MKFLLFGLAVLVAALSVANSQSIVETLIARAQAIITRARADEARFHLNGRGHLVGELNREIHLIEQLERELRAHPAGHVLSEEERHRVEERLLRHENTLIEEVRRIEAYNANLYGDRMHYLQMAEALLARAKRDLARQHAGGRGHLVAEIEHEVTLIEGLVNELRAHPSNALEVAHARQIEQRLGQHEQRLAAELRRIEGGVAPVAPTSGV